MTTQEPSKEELILQAAAHEFAIKGFDGARTTIIAEKAGVTHAMLHYYFRTKEQLFEQILVDKFRQLLDMMSTIFMQPGKSLRERIAAGVRAHFDFIRNHSDLPFFVINAVNREPDRIIEFQRQMTEKIASLLSPLQSELAEAARLGEIRPIEIHSLIINMVSLNLGPFISRPLIESMLNISNFEALLDAKREENVNIILKLLCFD
ncbi:MAG: TetR/AcrR family transcriptional regulator [Muribaculaceae bacterium]|nr:TetR/AcrR family transcriptional regulator [Muribaculaceae bacterium]